MKSLRPLALVALALLPTAAAAQTSGTLTTQTSQNWNTAPWAITGGAGTFPDGGGTATWNTHTNTTVGTVAGGVQLTLTTPVTLSGITYNSPYALQIAGSAANTLGLAATGGTFDAQLSLTNTLTLFSLTNSVLAPVTGGGSAGLTKTGSGTVTLGSTAAASSFVSSYTGGTHINGGLLAISATAATGDGVLGATGAGNGLSFNGGALFVNVAGGWATTRDVLLEAAGGQIFTNTNATINGVVSGAGALTNRGFAAAAGLTLTNANTYTGATVSNASNNGSLTLGGNGTIASSSSYDFAGAVVLSNTAANANNRLSDTAAITSRGAAISLTGNAAAATAETAGAVTLVNAVTTITVTPDAGQAASLTFAGVTRQNNSTLFVRGTNLGAAPAAGVAQIVSAASPGTLVGGGGAPGSTTISILPWATGNVTANATTNSSFVTWDSGTGQFRPLNTTTEFAALASGANGTDNAKVAVVTSIDAPTTVNSVLVTATGTPLTGTGGLTITSGALFYSPASVAGSTISANINFGPAEGVISTTAGNPNSTAAGLILSGVITGTGGVTFNSVAGGNIAPTNANNSYTGTTTLLNGLTSISGTVASGANSVFGADTSAVVVSPGTTNLSGIYAFGATTMNRDLSIAGTPANPAYILTSGAYTYTQNGNIAIAADSRLSFYNTAGGTAAAGFVVNGNISGGGFLTDNTATTFITLNGNNTYSGGTNVLVGTYLAGSNTAFGTGPINFSNTATPGKIQSSDATARSLPNGFFLGANPTFQGTGDLAFAGAVNLNGSRTVNVTSTSANGVAFTGVVSNGGLTKTGAGVLALNSPTGNTYTGGTVLGAAAGTLTVNNTSGSGTGTGTVSVGGTSAADRSTLSGSFSISGATSISGALTPGGAGVGTATFGSTLTFTANALTTLNIAGASSADKINVGGALALGGSAITVTTIGGYQAVLGDTYDLLDWGSVSGTVTLTVTGAALADPANTMWDTSLFASTGVISVVAVPEPSLVLGVAGLGLLGVRKRRRRRAGV